MIDAHSLVTVTATPIDIAVRWAVEPADAESWRTSGVDRYLRWMPNEAGWGQRKPHGLCSTILVYTKYVVEYTGHVFAFHPDGYALVMEASRMLVVLPVGALRVESLQPPRKA